MLIVIVKPIIGSWQSSIPYNHAGGKYELADEYPGFYKERGIFIRFLKKEKVMSTEKITLLVAAISTIGAITGVIIGSIVSFLVARQQFKATVISANRQQWINTLRDSIADFQTKAKIALTEDILSLHATTSVAADAKGHYDALKTMRFLRNKMALLLNPIEADHVQLLSSLKELEDFCVHGAPLGEVSYEKLQDSITLTGQRILKQEWDRVKRGK